MTKPESCSLSLTTQKKRRYEKKYNFFDELERSLDVLQEGRRFKKETCSENATVFQWRI